MATHRALIFAIMLAALAFAQAAPAEKYIAASIAVGATGIGAGVAIALAGSAAMSAMVERPERAVWYLIFLALGEAIAIYGLLIAILMIL